MYNYRNSVLIVVLTVLMAGYGCNPSESGTNLDAVISPYRLFLGTANGDVANTNNGSDYRYYSQGSGVSINSILTVNDYLFFGTSLISRQKEGDKTSNVVYGNSGDPVFNPLTGGNIIYAEDEGVIYAATDGASPVIYSTDMGNTWNSYGDAEFVSGSNDADGATSVVHIDGGKTYFADTYISNNRTQKFFSKNNGSQTGWKEINTPNLEDNTLYRLATSGTTLLAYDVFGIEDLVFYSTTGATDLTTTKQVAVPADAGIIFSVEFYEDQYLYLCTTGGLFRMDTRNNLFTKLNFPEVGQTAVPDVSFKKTIYSSGNEKVSLFVATENGLYESEDFGESFTKIYDGTITQLN